MNWHNITLLQFQDLHRLKTDTELDEFDRVSRAICIIYNKTEKEVDDMQLSEYNRLAKECGNMLTAEAIPGKAVKSFRVGAKKYAMNYYPTTLKHRQYVEIISFSEKPIENMHLIMASLVKPVRYGFTRQNKSEDHVKVASDMLNAPFLAVYHSCVFFCQLYRNLIEHIRGFLKVELMSKGKTEKQANEILTALISAMDGFSQPSKSPFISA